MKLTALALAAVAAGASAAELKTMTGAEIIEGEYIVKMKSSCSKATLRSVAKNYFTNGVWESLPGFKGFAARLTTVELEEMLANEDVEFVEPDSVVRAIGGFRTENGSAQATCSAKQTGSAQSWGQSRTTSLTSVSNSAQYEHEPEWGAGVKVYVIDTGSSCSHNEFDACECGPSFVSGFGAGADGCADGNGHGTHCSSTAAGALYGVAKQATIVGVQVLGSLGSGSTAGVINGMNWVASEAQSSSSKSVASMSLGGGSSSAMDNAVDAMVDAGVFIAVAAGNCNDDACRYSPAGATGAYTVGATTISDSRSSFSNYGTCVDIFAPGSDITAAWYNSDSATRTISGTSMACPHVAGAAAAVWSENPSYSVAQVKTALTNLALDDAISGNLYNAPNKLLHLEC